MNQFGITNQTTAPRPQGFTSQQTGGAYNNQVAQAKAMADPRMNEMALDKPGFSRGEGTQKYAASNAANQYAQGMAQAEAIPMQDAVSNAQLNLQYDVSQDQMGLSLAALQEQIRQQRAMYAIQDQGARLGLLQGLID